MNECCKETMRNRRQFMTFEMKYCIKCGTRVIRECKCQKNIFIDENFCPYCGRDAEGNKAPK